MGNFLTCTYCCLESNDLALQIVCHEDWQELVRKTKTKKATAASAEPNDTNRGFHRMSSNCVAWQISS